MSKNDPVVIDAPEDLLAAAIIAADNAQRDAMVKKLEMMIAASEGDERAFFQSMLDQELKERKEKDALAAKFK